MDLLIRIGGKSLPEAARPITARPIREDDPSDIPTRLERMDDAGVQLQVLSPAASPPYAEKEADAVEAARGSSTTPTPSSPRSTRTGSRPSSRCRCRTSTPRCARWSAGSISWACSASSMTCSVFDRSTAEAEFEPLYAEMNRRGAVLYYHPIQNGICSPFLNDYGFTVAVGASLEDTVIGLHLIARRVPERFPNIKYVIPHLGGMLPMQLQRLDNQGPRTHPNLPEPPSVTARRFYYDTVGHGSQAALLCAWKAFGADQLVPAATTRS